MTTLRGTALADHPCRCEAWARSLQLLSMAFLLVRMRNRSQPARSWKCIEELLTTAVRAVNPTLLSAHVDRRSAL